MPLITVDGPRIDVARKRDLVRRMTDVAVDVYGIKHGEDAVFA